MTDLPADVSSSSDGPGRRTSASTLDESLEALRRLAETRPDLADVMARLVAAVASEAGRTARFANSLEDALMLPRRAETDGNRRAPKRTGRRASGVLDPFAVHSDSGNDGLRDRLSRLDLEQLRDIVAEHGMDHDRLAMKWKDPSRVIDRIVDKVSTRAAKGSAFRPTNN